MFIDSQPGATAATAQPVQPKVKLPEPPPQETVRHLLFGSLSAVRATIKHLHKLHYANPNDWSRPISTGRPNEVMAILTKRVSV